MKVYSILLSSLTLLSNTVFGTTGDHWKIYQCHNAAAQPRQVTELRVAVHPCHELEKFKRLDKNPAMVLNERLCSPMVVHYVRKGQTSYPVAAQFETYTNSEGVRNGSFRSQFLPLGLENEYNSFQCGEQKT